MLVGPKGYPYFFHSEVWDIYFIGLIRLHISLQGWPVTLARSRTILNQAGQGPSFEWQKSSCVQTTETPIAWCWYYCNRRFQYQSLPSWISSPSIWEIIISILIVQEVCHRYNLDVFYFNCWKHSLCYILYVIICYNSNVITLKVFRLINRCPLS